MIGGGFYLCDLSGCPDYGKCSVGRGEYSLCGTVVQKAVASSMAGTGGDVWSRGWDPMLPHHQKFSAISGGAVFPGKSSDAFDHLWENVPGITGEAIWRLYGSESVAGWHGELDETDVAGTLVSVDFAHGLCRRSDNHSVAGVGETARGRLCASHCFGERAGERDEGPAG